MAIPITPTIVYPAENDLTTVSNVQFIMTESPGAAAYYTLVSTTPDMQNSVVYDYNTLPKSKYTYGLGEFLDYYWQVWAENEHGQSPRSDVYHFRTTKVGEATTPILLSPSNGATNVSTNPSTGGYTVEWQPVQAARYYVQLFTDPYFVYTSTGWYMQTNGTSKFFEVPIDPFREIGTQFVVDSSTPNKTYRGLKPNTTYYWRVMSEGSTTASGTGSPWSDVYSFTTGNTAQALVDVPPLPPLLPPTLNSPINGQVVGSTTISLAWIPAQGATTYEVELDLNPYFDGDTVFITTVNTSTVVNQSDTGFDPNRLIYWRVRSVGGTGVKSDWVVNTFTTSNGTVTQPPPTPTATVPLPPVKKVPQTTIVDGKVQTVFEWSMQPGADKYNLQYHRANSDQPVTYITTIGAMATTATNYTLTPDTAYEYNVQSGNIYGYGSFGPTWTQFHTPSMTTTTPPPTEPGVPITPSLNPTVRFSTSPSGKLVSSFQWNSVLDAASYILKLRFGSSPQWSEYPFYGAMSTTADIVDLVLGSQYEATITAVNSMGVASQPSTPVIFFNTPSVATSVELPPAPVNPPPPMPEIVGPTLLTNVNSKGILFKWNGSPAATSYEVRIYADASYGGGYAGKTGIVGFSSIFDLEDGADYWWEVRAIGASGVASEWARAQFTTTGNKVLPPPPTPSGIPSAPTLKLPLNDSKNIPATGGLSWNAAPSALAYQVQVSKTNTFEANVLPMNVNGIATTAVTAQGLQNATKYYWRVRASNNAGAGAWSIIRNFTTTDLSLNAKTGTGGTDVVLGREDGDGTTTPIDEAPVLTPNSPYDTQIQVDSGQHTLLMYNAPDGQSKKVVKQYTIEIYPDGSPNDIKSYTLLKFPSVTATLVKDKVYKWRGKVDYLLDDGLGNYLSMGKYPSTWWTFTTVSTVIGDVVGGGTTVITQNSAPTVSKPYIQYVDVSAMIKQNTPKITVGDSYTELINNKNEVTTLNKEIIKKNEIVYVNLILKGDKDYSNLTSNSSIFTLDGQPYNGSYHYMNSLKGTVVDGIPQSPFRSGGTEDENSHELRFIYENPRLDYSDPSVLSDINTQLTDMNSKLNANINTLSIQMSKQLNFLMGLEKTLDNFYGYNADTYNNSLKGLIESNLLLTKYQTEVNWVTLITQFNLSNLSTSALENIYANFYINYIQVLNMILISIPQTNFQESLRITSVPYTNWELNKNWSDRTTTKYYQTIFNDFHMQNPSEGKWPKPQNPPQLPWCSLFDFSEKILNNKTSTKVKNLLSVLLGTVDTIDSKDINYNMVLAFDFAINKFPKIFSDMADKQARPELKVFPLEYLISKSNDMKFILQGFTDLFNMIDASLSTQSVYITQVVTNEKRVFNGTSYSEKVLTVMHKATNLMVQYFTNISLIIEALAKVNAPVQTGVSDYITVMDTYKWYSNGVSLPTLVTNGTALPIFENIAKLDKLNWPSSKQKGYTPPVDGSGYFLHPTIFYYGHGQNSAKNGISYIHANTWIYIPPFGWEVSKFNTQVMADIFTPVYLRDAVTPTVNGSWYETEPGRVFGEGSTPTPNIYEKNFGTTTITSPFTNYDTGDGTFPEKERGLTAGNTFTGMIQLFSIAPGSSINFKFTAVSVNMRYR